MDACSPRNHGSITTGASFFGNSRVWWSWILKKKRPRVINDGAGRKLYVNYSIGNKSTLSLQYLVEHPASSNSPLADTNASLIAVAGPLFDKSLLKTHRLHFLWSYACPIYFGRQLVLQTMDCTLNLIPNLKLQMVGIGYVHRSIWR